VSADDVGADHVADVNRRGRRDSGVRESGIENRWIWFSGAYQRGVDDPGHERSPPWHGLADTSVGEILGCVPVGVGHNHDGNPSSTQGVNGLYRSRPWFAPQNLVRVPAIGNLSQGAECILHPPGRHAQLTAERSHVTDSPTVGNAAIKQPDRPVMSMRDVALVTRDPGPLQGASNEIAAG
jgi:hypothetical protein